MDTLQIPPKIKSLVGNQTYTIDNIGQSGSRVLLFDTMVLKIEVCPAPGKSQANLLNWLNGKLPAPRVLAHETEHGMSFLLMSRIDGEPANNGCYLTQPNALTKALALGLKMLWEVDVTDCPVIRDPDTVLKEAYFQVKNHLVDLGNVEPTTFGHDRFENPKKLLIWLEDNCPPFEPVFSHGDYTLPNIFLENGQIKGFIDLDKAGIGDRWNDIALCYRSLKRLCENHEDFSPDLLFEELEIRPNWEKIRYYLLLDELF